MAVWKTKTKSKTESSPVQSSPILFLDRDGVVIRDKDYLADPAGVELLPGVAEAMIKARAAGFQIVGVSNQSGIGRGYFSVCDFDAVMIKLAADLAELGAWFDGFFYCPHGPDDGCACRKPGIGLLAEAAAHFHWNAAASWIVGDKGSDVALGQKAGLGSVLVSTGYGAQEAAAVKRRWSGADRVFVAADLAAAVDLICNQAAGAPEGP